jgi:predicted RNase H-like HicB family nuclease
MKREFYVLIEQDEDGLFIGEVPQLRGCYTQGRTLDELLMNIREVIQLCLEDQPEIEDLPEFLGVQKVTI